MTVIRLLVLLGMCLPVVACYEEPVRDHLHIRFVSGGFFVVTAVREISPPGSMSENPAVEDRMDEARSELSGGWDRWSRSFAGLGALADRSTIVRHDGRPNRGVHSALLDRFRPIERLLENEGLGAALLGERGLRELQLYPTGGAQATRQQRETFERLLPEWSEHVTVYLAAVSELYAHLERAPGRAVPCLAHVFDTHPEQSGPLSAPEETLVKKVTEAMDEVASVLLIGDQQAYSLNELSRLVFDCFQGRLTVAVDGPVLETEGFVAHSSFVERPPVDLWRALEGLVGNWIEPDLVTAAVRPGPDASQPEPDPIAFAAIPRFSAPAPDARAVETLLRARLTPADLYRVRWQTRPGDEEDEDDRLVEAALDLLVTAETDLPN